MNEKMESSPQAGLFEEARKCIECGTCLHSCPVYRESLDERIGPRGRNRLLREQAYAADIFANNHLQGLFDKCLLCGRCVAGCPRGVQNDLTVLQARSELVRRHGLSLAKTIAFRKLLADKTAMRRAVRLAGRLQWLLPRTRQRSSLPERQPLRHLPLLFLGLGKGFELPALPEAFLGETVPETTAPIRAMDGRNLRVAFFTGCAAEYFLPGTGRAVIELLASLGVTVVVPREQGCCGIAVQANGDAQTARTMALKNLEALSRADVDLVVTACATCGSSLKEGWTNLFRGDPRQEQFRALAGKTRDLSELLIELSGHKPLTYRSTLPPGTRVTYHDPCHLARYQGITEQPRRILRQAFGSDFVEMDYKGCCGCGGSFSLHSHDLSQRIGAEKIEAIARTGADVVVNMCPGCMIQIASGIVKRRLPQQVLHLAEVVAPQ